jgi:nucleoid-associated protein YgaU
MVAKQAAQTSVAEAPAVKAADTQVELVADPADSAEGQLVSHETKSPNFVDRLKRSFQPILGR